MKKLLVLIALLHSVAMLLRLYTHWEHSLPL